MSHQSNLNNKSLDDLEENEYMLSSVPFAKRRPTWKQIMVWIGFGYVATGFIVGGTLAGGEGQPGLPPLIAFLSIAISMGILFIITSLLGVIAQRTGLNLALISRYSYGSKGTNLPLVIMAFLTLGWFASINGMISDALKAFIGNPSGISVITPESLGFEGIEPITLEEFLSMILFGLIFTMTVYFGIKAIENVASIISPLILIMAVVAGIGMIIDGGGVGAIINSSKNFDGLEFGTSITIITGSWIAGVIMGVDFFRFNKTIKGVFAGAFACFIITNPILNIVGYIGVTSIGSYNYIIWLNDYGWVLGLIGVIGWVAALWTTNNAELYCNALYTGPVISSYKKTPVRRKSIVLVVGIVGTIISALGFYQLFFEDFITVLGAAFLPLGGPIIADYYLVKKQKYDASDVHSQRNYKWSGILSFIISATVGVTLEFFVDIPYGLPSSLIALALSVVLYLIIYNFTDKAHDKKEKKINEELFTS